MTRVLACGGLTIDWLQTDSGRFGPSLGGNAADAAVGAWLAGADAEVVAVIGDDYPAELLEALSAAGIGTSSVRTSPGPSFRVLLDESGPRRTVSYLPDSGHNDRLDPLPSQLPELHGTDAVHVCPIPTASQRALIEALAGRVGTVTLDTVIIPGEIEPEAFVLLDLAQQASVFMPSRDEVDQHWPGGVEDALHQLVDAGCPRVVVKLGPDGSIGRDGSDQIRVPAAQATVVDPIGAGDSYCGAVCARVGAGDSLATAMRWGAAAASVIIEGHGAAHALTGAGRARVINRVAELEQRVATVTRA
jgi:sugar/nucleoside kinase (ribokinase family)